MKSNRLDVNSVMRWDIEDEGRRLGRALGVTYVVHARWLQGQLCRGMQQRGCRPAALSGEGDAQEERE